MSKANDPDDPPIPLGRPTCRAHSKSTGAPCRKKAAAGSAYCASHGGGKRPPGKPGRLDDALINTLAEVVERGVTWDVAAQAAGIATGTLHMWRARGADDLEAGKPSIYAELVERLTRATAEAERYLIEAIRGHALVDWRAGAWILERRHAERWARQDRLDVEIAKRAEPRVIEPAEPKTRDTILELLAKATRPPAGLIDQ
jgi:hypothetical protein